MFEDTIYCRNCMSHFRKGEGHLLFCADCDSRGEDGRHPICDNCYSYLLSTGKIKKVTYNKGDLAPDLVEKLR